jgi:hypothetical protein
MIARKATQTKVRVILVVQWTPVRSRGRRGWHRIAHLSTRAWPRRAVSIATAEFAQSDVVSGTSASNADWTVVWRSACCSA